MSRSHLAAAISMLLLASPACTRARAKTVPETAPLEMPAPPPRDVEPIEADAPPPAPAGDASRATPPRPRPAPPPPPARTEPPKPEQPPKTDPAPPEPARPAEEPPRTPTNLQTAPATAASELSKTIQTTLTRANSDLNRVDYRRLNADARLQYDTAKRFIRQADEAVRAKNLVFARNLADKAAALAAQLAGQ